MLKLTFIDTESAWDEYLHEDYRAIDAAGVAKLERQGRKRHNQACKRIFAAAALDLVINDDRTMDIEGLTAWTEREYGDEQAVVEGLLDHIRYRPDHRIVAGDLNRVRIYGNSDRLLDILGYVYENGSWPSA